MSLKSGIKAPSKKTSESSRNVPSRNGSEAAMSRSSSVSTLASVAEGRESVSAGSFAVGDRVWVNGTKPGYVQFIGQTQFSPGVWAGVILDEKEGKNDGSVEGVRYFDCEPNRGIFIRPHRLTREAGAPPVIGDPNQISPQSKEVPGSNRQKTPPRSSVTTPSKPVCSKLRPGERVVCNSSTGVKLGILRYVGTTEFAVGDWAGIELDEPLGRNDGSVGGKRYFQCAMNYGLFAPLHKISRAGGTMMPRSTSHSGSFSRSCSKESLNSSVSSVSSSRAGRVKLGITSLSSQKPPKGSSAVSPTQNALQEALKEKEEHISQLLRERDLERSEVARAVVEAEETRQRIAKLQEEFSLTVQQNEAKIQQLQSSYEKAQKDAKSAAALLEEEKRKMEDLQFRWEEEMILKSEVEAQLEKDQQKIKELEMLLKDDKKNEEFLKKTASLEASLKERDAAVSKLQCEFDSIRVHLSAKEAEVNHLSLSIQEAKESLQAAQSECTKVKSLQERVTALEKENKQLSDIQKDLTSQVHSMKEALKNAESQCSDMQCKMSTLEANLKDKEGEVSALKESIEKEKAAKISLSENLQAIEVLEAAQKSTLEKVEMMTKEIESLSAELALKDDQLKESRLEIEFLTKSSEEKNMEISKLASQLQDLERQYSQELAKNKSHACNLEEKISAFEKTCSEHQNELLNKDVCYQNKVESITSQVKEQEKLLADFDSRVASLLADLSKKDEVIQQLNEKLKDAESEITILSKDKSESVVLLQNKISEMQVAAEQIQNETSAALERASAENESLSKLLKEKAQLLSNNAEIINTLEKTLADKENQLSCIKSELKVADETASNMTKNITTLNEQVDRLKLENEEKEKCLTTSREKEANYEAKMESLSSQLKDYENLKADLESQVAQLQADLNKKDEAISQLGKKLREAENEVTMLCSDKSESLTMLQNKITEMRKDYEQAQSDAAAALESSYAEKEHLSKLLKEQEQLALNSTSSVTALEKSLAEKEKHLSEINSELQETKGKMEGMAKNVNTFSNQVDQLAAENQEKEKCLLEKEEKLRSLSAEISKYTTIMEESGQANAKKQAEVSELRAALASKEEQITELGMMVESSQQQLLLLKQQNDKNLSLMESRVASFRQEQEKHLLEKEKVLQAEIERLQTEISTKDKALETSLSQISEWEEQVKHRDNDIQKLQQLLKEQEAKVISSLEDKQAVAEFESKLLSLQSTCEKLEKEKNEMAQKEHAAREARQALEKAKDLLIHDKKEQEALVKDRDAKLQMLQQEVERMRCDFIQHKDQLQGKLDVSQMELEAMKEFKSELEMQQGVMEELQQQLQEAENEKLSLEEQLKNVPAIKNLESEVSDLKKELLSATNRAKEESEKRQNTENQLKSFQDMLKDKEAEIEILKSIQITSDDSEGFKTKVKGMEIEKQGLLEQIAKLQALVEKNPHLTNVSASDPDEDDEKEALRSQINFLNSIIVDMQRQNEELKNKQEGLNDMSDADINFNGIRQIPPRLFCDICDMFDLHDTDDCPKQSSFSEEEVPHSRHKGKRNEERPYCNNCEMFGHWTLECDEQETF